MTFAKAGSLLEALNVKSQSSQAIPLDGILDAAGRSFLQNLFGGAPAQKPVEPEQAATDAENTDAPAAEVNNSEGEATSSNQ